LSIHHPASSSTGLRHVQEWATAALHSELPLEGGSLQVRCLALARHDLVVMELEATEVTASVTAGLDADNELDNFCSSTRPAASTACHRKVQPRSPKTPKACRRLGR